MKRLIAGFLLGVLATLVFGGCATTNGTMEHERHETGIKSHTSDY